MNLPINEENYSYFLTEAQDLLQSIEQELLTLKEEFSPAKVHEIMRSAHTLKGAAASVGLDTIKEIAHVFEDVFKGLCNPEIVIDAEIESLLFQGYECLRLPLMAHFNQGTVDECSMLDRAASIIAQLQEKLGDCFDRDAPIPTSTELGFDVVQSVFEAGVEEKLQELEAIAPEDIAPALQAKAEVLLGIGESFGLPGFAAIASATIGAIKHSRDQIEQIATTAIADFRAGQAAVLEGDRTLGGEPSELLVQLAGMPTSEEAPPMINSTSAEIEAESEEEASSPLGLDQLLQNTLEEQPAALNVTAAEEASSPLELDQLLQNTVVETAVEPAVTTTTTAPPAPKPMATLPPTTPKSPKPKAKRQSKPTETKLASVRVGIEQLERLDHLAGELLINQNQQTNQDQQLRLVLQEITEQLQQHRQTMSELRNWSDRHWITQERSEVKPLLENFDPLEMDRYSEVQVLFQKAIDQTVRLENLTEAIASSSKQARRLRDCQQRLLTNVRDDLTTARMQPLGELFNRFPRVVHQLVTQYKKPAELILEGTEVLIDKAIVEKLYDPLLHLIRNAFDHGIDSSEDRQAHQKPEVGRIEVRAYHQGNRTIIEIKDDGQGIDLEKIKRKAVEQGLATPAEVEVLSEAAILEFLFEPGFSTASAITDLSGRGVGLDVVRSLIRALHGSITVTSIPYGGTTFSLEIPLSITITKLLVCSAGKVNYALPVNTIEQILIPQPHQLGVVGKNGSGMPHPAAATKALPAAGGGLSQQMVLHWQENGVEILVPVYQLGQLMSYSATSSQFLNYGAVKPMNEALSSTQSPLLLIRTLEGLIALQVEQILGEKELVIRPLGAAVATPSYVYGCCILTNSRLALAIDPEKLVGYQHPQTAPLPVISSPTKAISPAAVQNSKALLVVDDSLTLRQTIGTTLKKCGYQVYEAEDGQAALEKMQQHSDIRLIICDVEMPRLNGFEFLNRVRQNYRGSKVPIIMLTSRSGNKYRQIAIELGASGYLTKPYVEAELLSTITHLLS